MAGSLPVFYLAYAGFQLWRGHVVMACVLVLGSGLFVAVSLRPPTVVDEWGIRRPYRLRRRSIPWSDVEAIVTHPTAAAPGSVPRVALTGGGRSVVLDDIPPDQAALVARIGDRPLRRPPIPGVTTRLPPRAPREKTRNDIDVEADVARRAAALDEGWAELEAENRHRPRASGRLAEPSVDPTE